MRQVTSYETDDRDREHIAFTESLPARKQNCQA